MSIITDISSNTYPKIHPQWSFNDHLGALRVRLSIGRNSYQVKPGLYAFGNPGKESEVIVTSNYKLSFDIVRRSLQGLNAWVLVLETYGINVWCAAGKGTFGTEELIRQIEESQVRSRVSHKRVIVPQLGAPGVSAHEVKEATGFRVKFGPVRAGDIKEYVSAGLKKSEDMRTVQFNFIDRLILAPVEIANSLWYLLYAIIAVFLLSGFGENGFALSNMWPAGLTASMYLLTAYVAGAFITPVLLPWIPSRYFGAKGLITGILMFVLVALWYNNDHTNHHLFGWLLISGAISSFLAMNFTGASTYTSLSGVRKEMRIFVPLQILLILIGIILVIISKFQ